MSVAPKYLLDTDICIFIQRQSSPSAMARFEQLRRGEGAISAITYGELLYGAMKSQRAASVLQAVNEFVTVIPVSELPPDSGRHYGEIKCDLERRGLPIGPNDLWIAAHARAMKLTLVTNNSREFGRIPGLSVENWTE